MGTTKLLTLFILLLSPASILAQKAQVEYSVAGIPESLRKTSDAVLRYGITEFTYNSVTSATAKTKEVITVLNQSGEEFAYFSQYADNDRYLKSFSGTIYDAAGRPVKKIKKSDLLYTEYSSSLATDGKTYFYDSKTASYPYTVAYEYEVARTDAILTFPSFYPATGYRQGVQKAEYVLNIPPDVKFSYKGVNFDAEPEKQSVNGRDVYLWSVTDMAPIESEPYLPDIFPRLMLIPGEFTFAKTHGSLESWERYGEWQCGIMEGRDELPQELKDKLHEMTASAASDREKVEILYKYLGETTRYVSVQIGIGGLQPMMAAEVYKQKFGDCKALSFYMKSMLKELGIESYYTEIFSSSRPRSIIPDFPHQGMSNHAILCVALDDGPLWLECTNPKLPFGYIHSSISGRHAVSYKDNTGNVVYIPQYADSLNVIRLTADISLNGEEESLQGRVSVCYEMRKYEELFRSRFAEMDSRERLNYVSKGINFPLAKITDISYREEKSAAPSSCVEYSILASPKISGSRVFLPMSLLKSGSAVKLPRTRKHDIQVFSGHTMIEDITVAIPVNRIPEAMPADKELSSEFGSYRSQVRYADGKLKIHKELMYRSGRYDVSEYSDFKQFVEKVYACDAAEIILKLKE